MRVFITMAALVCYSQFLFSQSYNCPQYTTATGFYDGESLWWREDKAQEVLTEKVTFQFDEASRTFTLQTPVRVCPFGFEVVQAPDPTNCPYQPYTWQLQTNNNVHVLTVQFPSTIQPCLPSSGQTEAPYHFRFKIFYLVPVVDTKTPKS
jgi:hypothetical protein